MDVVVVGLKGKALVLICTALLLFLSPFTIAEASDKNVVFVVTNKSPAYTDFINAFSRELGNKVKTHTVPDSTHRDVLQHASLIITLGTESAREIGDAGLGIPTMNALVTRTDYQRLQANDRFGASNSVLYLDQPVKRMLGLIKVGLPERQRITVALGPASKTLRHDVITGCQQVQLQCDVMVVEGESGVDKALMHSERDGKVLLVLPDPRVVNSITARNLILGAYRRGVALVGYSRALVKAGALMAVYSTPSQLGLDAAKMARKLLTSTNLRSRQTINAYPRHYAVSVNYQLARALRLTLDTEQTLLRAVQQVEGND